MRIAELSDRNPLARAGFRPGDRLVRINGEPLLDPAQIAHLFTALGDRFEVCVDREALEDCRVVVLR
nr:PDZ domain-containing protein [Microbulbifer rhizosphaerae]